MKWIINRKKIEWLKCICVEIITIISILMALFGTELAWRFLGDKKSQWYEEAVAYRLTKDRFIAEKAGMIFMLLSAIGILLILAGLIMYLLVRRNILVQLKKVCRYLKIFGYPKLRITGILFLDAVIDLIISLLAVLPIGALLWHRFQNIEVIQNLMLLTEAGTKIDYFSVLIIYLGMILLALIQINIRKESEKNGNHRRSKKNSKNIQK